VAKSLNSVKICILISLTLALANAIGLAAGELVYTPYAISTVAGRAGIVGTKDGIGALARFNHPESTAVDTNGNVYIADTFNGSIRKLTLVGSTWVVSTIVSNLSYPNGVGVDGNGVVYVADTGNNVIRKVTPMGSNWVLTTFATGFNNPAGVAVDANFNVYVADTENSVIRKVTSSGTVSTLAGTVGSTGTNDGTGSAARFYYPNSVAVDTNGNVYVADSSNDTIRKVTAAGVVSTLAGSPRLTGAQDGAGRVARFNDPFGVAVDNATNVYVTDYGNDTIRRISWGGTNWTVTTLAGLAGLSGSTDATGIDARFYTPTGLAVNTYGVLYIADDQNFTVRQAVLVINPPVIVIGSEVFVSNHFGFSLTGTMGQTIVVQGSTDLINWLPLWTNTFGTNALSFSDPTNESTERFYRAVTP
jgi:streptogramin lyase